MAYTRKTRDFWEIQANYGQGWEFECAEFSWKDTKEQLRAYRENIKYPVRAVKRREPLTREEIEYIINSWAPKPATFTNEDIAFLKALRIVLPEEN